jgi:hypothetical protein
MKNERAILAIAGALIIGMFLGRYGLGGPEVNTRYEYTAESASAVKAMDLAIGGSPSMGAELAKVTIIESSDFQ